MISSAERWDATPPHHARHCHRWRVPKSPPHWAQHSTPDWPSASSPHLSARGKNFPSFPPPFSDCAMGRPHLPWTYHRGTGTGRGGGACVVMLYPLLAHVGLQVTKLAWASPLSHGKCSRHLAGTVLISTTQSSHRSGRWDRGRAIAPPRRQDNRP